MAAPPEITLQNLNGVFILNRSLSSDTDSILALQGIGWLMRKAINVATVTLSISETIEPNSDDPDKALITKIVINQTATGNLKSTEVRITDWRTRPHTDRVFGTVNGHCRLLRAPKPEGDAKARPTVDVQSNPEVEKVVKFLKGEIDIDGKPDEGFIVDEVEDKEGVSYGEGEGLWLQSWVKNESSGWHAEQIWGFEIVDGQRRHTRRVVVTDKSGKWLLGRLVYDYQGPVEQ